MCMPCHVIGETVFSTVRRFVRSTNCDCIALSGGIDTSVVALAAVLEGVKLRALTAYYVRGLARDLIYAIHVAKILGLEHILLPLDDNYIASRAGFVISCTGRYDYIELRNDVVFLRVLEEAAAMGCRCIYLGDGGDEVFAGYEFMHLLNSLELRRKILHYIVYGRYPGLQLADCMGFKAYAPLLNDEVAEIILKTPMECLRSSLGSGKALLRDILAHHGLWLIAERSKTPAEAGAGTTILGKSRLEAIVGTKLSSTHY